MTQLMSCQPKREQYQVRRATPADWAELVSMYASFEPKGAFLGLPPRAGLSQWLGNVEQYPNLVIEAHGRIVAHGFLCPEGHAGELAIFVHQDYRNRGLGRALLSALVEEGRRLGLRRLWGVTDLMNLRMMWLALSLGFVAGPTRDQFYLDLQAPAASVQPPNENGNDENEKFEHAEVGGRDAARCRMAKLLRAEAADIEQRGFSNFFQHTYACLRYGQANLAGAQRCRDCPLRPYVPEEHRDEAFPCQQIEEEGWQQAAKTPLLAECFAAWLLQVAKKLEGSAS